MKEIQKQLMLEQSKFVKKYNKTFGNVLYKGYSHLFTLELDFDWFTEKLKTIKSISDRIEEVSTDEKDYFVVKGPEGNIDMYVLNVYINGLYQTILSVISTIKESPFND